LTNQEEKISFGRRPETTLLLRSTV